MPKHGILALLALAAALDEPAWAVDINSEVRGTVADTDGLPVPGAEVDLVAATGIGTSSTTTDDDGHYHFPNVPPGDYTLKVNASAFQAWSSGSLRIELGSTSNIDVKLVASDSSNAQITVVGAAPAIDVQHVSTGATFDADFLKHIPSGREYQSAIDFAPGIVEGANGPSTHGSFGTQNQYYIDGVNTTDPVTNTFSANMNYDAIQSIQVITGGMDAEYGRALGGAFNIVTKSGGNQFEGTARVQYDNAHFVAAPLLPGEVRPPTATDEQLELNLGGPILKDKLWFFASFEGDRDVSAITVDPSVGRDLNKFPMVPRDYRSIYYFAKITAQPSAANRISVHIQGDPAAIDNQIQSAYVLPSAEDDQRQGGFILSAEHQFTPNRHVLLDTQVFYQPSFVDTHSALWDQLGCKAGYDADGWCKQNFVGQKYQGQPIPGSAITGNKGWNGYGGTDFSAGEEDTAYNGKRLNASLTSALTLFFTALGEHQAKVGFDGEYVRSNDSFPGDNTGIYYFAHPTGGDPNDLSTYTPQEKDSYSTDDRAILTGSQISWFVQDVWQPVERLTIRPGLRFDRPSLTNDTEKPVLQRLDVSPRLGAALDLTGDGKTSVHAYYGRFNDAGFLAVSSILNKRGSNFSQTSWDPKTNDWSTTPSTSSSSATLEAANIKNPYSDEYNFGFSRELATDLGFDATFIYKHAARFWEDDDTNLIWNGQGSDVIGYRNGISEPVWRLRTPDATYDNYTSVEVSLNKRFSNNFAMLASYTWSRAYGTNSADQATIVLDTPEQRPYEKGLLDYDTPHSLKISGDYERPDLFAAGNVHGGYTLGWKFDASSGTPYRHVLWNNYWQDFQNYDGPQTGDFRTPMYANLDLQAELNFGVGKGEFALGADCFNVFDDRTITSVNTEYGPDGTGVDNHVFGQVLGRQAPRSFDVYVRGEF